jgi:hypothetical protein
MTVIVIRDDKLVGWVTRENLSENMRFQAVTN